MFELVVRVPFFTVLSELAIDIIGTQVWYL